MNKEQNLKKPQNSALNIADVSTSLIDHLIIVECGWSGKNEKEIYDNSWGIIRKYHRYLMLQRTLQHSSEEINLLKEELKGIV